MSGSDIVLDTNIILLSGTNINEKVKRETQSLLSALTIVNYSEKHKEAIIRIRQTRRLKLPDAIVAATAIVHSIPLVTADKAFLDIPEPDVVYIQPPIE